MQVTINSANNTSFLQNYSSSWVNGGFSTLDYNHAGTTKDIVISNTGTDAKITFTEGNVSFLADYFGSNFSGTTSDTFSGNVVSISLSYWDSQSAKYVQEATFSNLPGSTVSALESYNSSSEQWNSDDTFSSSIPDGSVLNGGAGKNTVIYNISISNASISGSGNTYSVSASSGTDSLTNIQNVQFSDMSVNLSIGATAKLISTANLTSLEELYVAFFNRIPDANGLQYWASQLLAGASMNQIADNFYAAGVQYSTLTGYSNTMTNTDFINKVYVNVLGRTNGADSGGLTYWNNALNSGTTRGELVSQILAAAHTYKGDPTYGWVADLLDNKDIVSNEFAVTLGLSYNDASTSISQGTAIAAAVTSTDTSAAIALIGVTPTNIHIA